MTSLGTDENVFTKISQDERILTAGQQTVLELKSNSHIYLDKYTIKELKTTRPSTDEKGTFSEIMLGCSLELLNIKEGAVILLRESLLQSLLSFLILHLFLERTKNLCHLA